MKLKVVALGVGFGGQQKRLPFGTSKGDSPIPFPVTL